MNQRFIILTRQSSLNSLGELTDSYVETGKVFGRAKHTVDGTKAVNNRPRPQHKVEIVSRNFPATTGDQIEYAGFRWEVEGVRRKHRSNNVTIIANRLFTAVRDVAYYLQPDGASFYLTPTGDKYQQP